MYVDKFYIEDELSSFYTREKKKDTAIQFTSSPLPHFLKKNVEARVGYLKTQAELGRHESTSPVRTGDRTQGIMHAEQALYHWAMAQVLDDSFWFRLTLFLKLPFLSELVVLR